MLRLCQEPQLDSLLAGGAHDVRPAPAAARGLGTGWAERASNIAPAAWQEHSRGQIRQRGVKVIRKYTTASPNETPLMTRFPLFQTQLNTCAEDAVILSSPCLGLFSF